MSIDVMSYVWKHSKHKGSELLTLLAIADFAHADGTNAWPSIKALSEKTRMTERNVQFVLRKLEASEELIIERNAGPKGCHLFRIPMDIVSGNTRREVVRTCDRCGKTNTPSRQLDRHHIIPKSWGGEDNEANIALLCEKCHDAIHAKLAKIRKDIGSPSLPYTAKKIYEHLGDGVNLLDWITSTSMGEKISPVKNSPVKISPENFAGEKNDTEGVKNSAGGVKPTSPEPLLDPSEEKPKDIPPKSPQGDDSGEAKRKKRYMPKEETAQKAMLRDFVNTAFLEWQTTNHPYADIQAQWDWFVRYCLSGGKQYVDFRAAFMNSFAWDNTPASKPHNIRISHNNPINRCTSALDSPLCSPFRVYHALHHGRHPIQRRLHGENERWD